MAKSSELRLKEFFLGFHWSITRQKVQATYRNNHD